MNVLAAAAMASLAACLWRRWRATDTVGDGAETLVLCTASWLATLGLLATVAALFGCFDAPTMTAACIAAALAVWPWRHRSHPDPRRTGPMRSRRWILTALGLAVVFIGLALRLPANDYALAGRDQGTYTLRAQHVMQTGSLRWQDEVLAQAATEASTRHGPGDILGLYPIESTPWRQDLYEGAYRPGWYLADRQRGTIVAQFLHLHPMLMACAGLVAGPSAVGSVVLLEATVMLLALWCVGRRLWPTGPWALLPVTLVAFSPLAIWVHRTALSEVPAAMLLWSAVLALLRSRTSGSRDVEVAAFLLGTVAWVRGNGWLWAPLILACTWLIPADLPNRRRPAFVYVAVLSGSVLVHAASSFPYLHDELVRQIPWPGAPSPWRLVWLFAVAVVGWLSIDELAFHRRVPGPWRSRILRMLPWLLLAVALAGLLSWAYHAHLTPGRPHARLDPLVPMLGWVVLAAAGVGIFVALRGFDPNGPRAPWWLALASILALTIVLYGRRNLPQLGLYYYGRYLVPELLVACALLATAAVRKLHRMLAGASSGPRWRRVTATMVSLAAAASLLASTASVLALHPTSRMRELAGADRIVLALAERIPKDAVVIAGGEGWHHGHTFNQIAGALQLRHGRRVLPYRSREAAYATAYELLVSGPRAHGRPPPDVFLLVNEATHHARLQPDEPPIAVVDDLLAPPLHATRVWAAEMFVHRLTPVTDRVPTRVTRDELRMVLMRLTADLAAPGHRVLPVQPEPRELSVSGGAGLVGSIRCLSPDTPVRIDLTPPVSGPHGVVLVAAPGTAERNPSWQVSIDGEPRALSMPRARARPRDTIGPLWVADGPSRIDVLGSSRAQPDAKCPHGGLLEVRILEPERSALLDAPATATTFAPPRDLGHAPEPTQWVSGRGLGRYRPGPDPGTTVRGVSLELTGEAPLSFAPEPMPVNEPLSVIVTSTGSRIDPAARLRILAEDEVIATVDPPNDRAGTWQSKPVPWSPRGPIATLRLELVDAQPDDVVWIRDIGLFSRGPVLRSVVDGAGNG